MNRELVDKVVHAVLYEATFFILTARRRKEPARAFHLRTRLPKTYSAAQSDREPCSMQTECLAR
ncbi:MAG: hypothetical protein Udaeo2_03450 [Candidatus Udaeobacter sp.]|nr:MAG: hypothetical protein Udaeo2_03450 [Candidatus Udaeobacter sp.]